MVKRRDRKSKALSVRISEKEVAELMRIAEARDVPGAQVVREAIRHAIGEFGRVTK